MIILGINDGHDAGAALVMDGRLVAAVAEERFTRRKHEATYPDESIKWCLQYAGLTTSDVDRVAVGSIHIPPRYYYLRREATFSIEDFYKEQVEYWKPLLLEGKTPNYRAIFEHRYDASRFPYDHDLIAHEDDEEGMRKARSKLICQRIGVAADRVTFYDHHSCHAWWAYGAMPRLDRPVLVYTTDGAGDGANGTVWIGQPGQGLTSLHRTSLCNIGRIYRNMTLLLGMKPAEHEFKVMGLAAYSNERHGRAAYEVFARTLQNDGLDFVYGEKPSDLYFWFKERLAWHRFDNIAYGLQRRTEELLAQWVRNGMDMTGATDVAFSGGVAQNVKANKAITELEGLTSLYTPPGPSDESLSIGAAFQDWFAATGRGLDSLEPLASPYLGPEYDDRAIAAALETEALPARTTISRVTPDDVAEILASGGVIGRLNGRMEFGPRALGNRSIMADPRDRKIVQVINDYVKQRDFWMPFAPSILAERVDDYISNPKRVECRFMTNSFATTVLGRNALAAGVHGSDFTARPNVVDRELNPSYHAIISAFERKTGVGAILNTSFNLSGEPIVQSPADALSTFRRSGLKHLLMGDRLISKPDA